VFKVADRESLAVMEFPWDPIRQEDAHRTHLTVEIIQLILEYQRRLQQIVLEYLNHNVTLIEPDLSKGIETIPYNEMIDGIETNLRNLVSGHIVVPGMQRARRWHGGLWDERFLDYTDVNRWFETIRLMHRFILTNIDRQYTTNNSYLGMKPDHQVLGIPKQEEWKEFFAFAEPPRRIRSSYIVLVDGVLIESEHLMR